MKNKKLKKYKNYFTVLGKFSDFATQLGTPFTFFSINIVVNS